MRSLPRLDRQDIQAIAAQRRCRLASLREVDRGVEGIVGALRRADAIDNTVLVFTSDNGLFEGEHRLAGGKRLPYAESIRVPFVARFPRAVIGAEPPARVKRITANIDLAPTLLELAGASPPLPSGVCRVMDGRSMLPLLTGHPEEWPDDRAFLLEMRACGWAGILTSQRIDVIHSKVPRMPTRTAGCREDEQVESYDLEADPHELNNLARSRSDLPPGTEAHLHALERCSGIAGRDPAPHSGHYCE